SNPTPLSGDHHELLIPFDGERYSMAPVSELEVLVRYKMSRPTRLAFSPSHHVSVFREERHRWMVSFRALDKKVREDFWLSAMLGGTGLDLRLLPHRVGNQPGTFVAFVLPPILPVKEVEPEKDVVVAIDVTGSIGPADAEKAKKAVSFCLERLNVGDRFNVVKIGTEPVLFADKLVPAGEKTVYEAVRFVESLSSEGGTDLYNGLVNAVELFPSRKRPSVVVLVGDGRSNIGLTKPQEIIEGLTKYNRARARFFVMALGKQADVAFLDKIAAATGGKLIHFSEKTGFEETMSRFFSGFSQPDASRLSMTWLDNTPEDVLPTPIPDIFRQEGVVLTGGYVGGADKTVRVKLSGVVRNRTETVTKSFPLPGSEPGHPYVPALWAMRKAANLLEKNRLKAPDTSETSPAAEPAREFGFLLPAHQGKSGAGAAKTDPGLGFWLLKNSLVPSDVWAPSCAFVQWKPFRLQGGVWTDTRVNPGMPTSRIPFLSEAYFRLLKEHPELGRFMALGPEVRFVQGDRCLEITTSR
ncbi:MAG: VWA domain-containing protein, partial [Pseudomonadota bacterium]